MNRPAILFVNLRRTPAEGRAALLAARSLGYTVSLLADKVPAYAKDLIADVELVDTYDRQQALAGAQALARRAALRGVITWADRDVELVAQLGQALDLPAPDPESAQKARNKYLMRQGLASRPELIPRHRRVSSWEELEAASAEIGYPAVLKPTGASGSKGIFEIASAADLRPAFEQLQRIARPESDAIFRHYGAELILEEYLAGPEFSVEGWVSHGEVHVAGITDKLTSESFHLEYQHMHPTRFSPAEQREIEAKTALVVQTLGLNHCVFHLEGKLCAGSFKLIEIAARIGGDYITSHLLPLSSGVSFYEQALRVVTGERPAPEARPQVYAGVRFVLADEPGRLARVDDLDQVLALPAVEHVFMELGRGAQIQLPPHNFSSQRVLAVIARHADYAVVAETLEQATTLARLDVRPA
jgi:biotin carboxylase